MYESNHGGESFLRSWFPRISWDAAELTAWSSPEPEEPNTSHSILFSDVSIIIPSTRRSSKWSLSFGFHKLIPVCISVRNLSSPYVLHVLPVSFSFIDHPSNILPGVQIQIVDLLIMNTLDPPVTSCSLGPVVIFITHFPNNLRLSLMQGPTNFSDIWDLPQKSRCQVFEMKQVSYGCLQILGATVQNLFALMTWCLGFVQSCVIVRLQVSRFSKMRRQLLQCSVSGISQIDVAVMH